jgi:DNA polymerase-3 subunit gamma/tau
MTADFAGRATRVAISGPNRLAISFQKAYTQAMQYCERPEQRQKLEQAFSRIAGRNIRFDFVLVPDEAAPAERPVPRQPSRRQRQHEMMRHPFVRKATELFDTEIIGMLDAPPGGEAGEQAS